MEVCLVRSEQEVWEFLLFTILDVCPMYAGEQNIENMQYSQSDYEADSWNMSQME